MAQYVTDLRAPTDDQETTRQHDAIDEWLAEYDVDRSAVDRFVDLAQSGADPGREQFTELVEAIGTGEYEYVIVWEISRLARLGSIYQRFFEECEDAGTTVAITDGWVEEVRPDGTGKLIADISAAVADEERRRLIKRTQAGVERAQAQGKWLGAVPKGFARDDEGYLQPVLDPDHENGEVGYLEVRSALARVDAGEAYRSVASDVAHLSRVSLSRIHKDDQRQPRWTPFGFVASHSRIHKDDQRREWYLYAAAEDERIDEALDQVRAGGGH